MKRRALLQAFALGALGTVHRAHAKTRTRPKTHLLSLSFDDGFRKSFFKTAEIFERYGLRGCFNVIASGHLPEFKRVDEWMDPALLGSFDDWNRLVRRGHEVMMHSWNHQHLIRLAQVEAEFDIERCITYFAGHLAGFQISRSVYNFAFNESTQPLLDFVLSKVKCARTQGDTAMNPIPNGEPTVTVSCESHGPDRADDWIDQRIRQFLDGPGGWCVINTHGLDGEGWGWLSSDFLDGLLRRLRRLPNLEIAPVGVVVNRPAGWNA